MKWLVTGSLLKIICKEMLLYILFVKLAGLKS